MPDREPKLVVSNLFKIFGGDPADALEAHRSGLNKDEIFARTGKTMAVCDASFSVHAGEVFVVMGLSGSGKSTLIRLLNRLIDPSAGTIDFEGRDIARMSRDEIVELRRAHISMVFQSFALMPHLSVIDNAAFGLEIAGARKEQRRERARDALDQVGLVAWSECYPSELSGGMQQRVGLARALATDPSVLLMDEAFSALDPLIRTEMQDELLKLQSEHQRTIIFITHDLDEAMRIGDRIAIMEGGRVVQVGTPDEILNDPADDYVSSFFRGVNISQVLTAGDIARRQQVTLIEREGTGIRAALERLGRFDRPFGYVVDKAKRYYGVVSVDSLERQLKTGSPSLRAAFLPGDSAISHDTKLGDILGRVADSPCGLAVIDERGRYMGVVSRAALLQTLDQGHSCHG